MTEEEIKEFVAKSLDYRRGLLAECDAFVERGGFGEAFPIGECSCEKCVKDRATVRAKEERDRIRQSG
jgi:hypothetical protein